MIPRLGKRLSLPFLPATPSSPSHTLGGLFEMTQHYSWVIDLPRALLWELQRNEDTIRCVVLGAEVTDHHQRQLAQTLMVPSLKNTLFTPMLDCEKSTA